MIPGFATHEGTAQYSQHFPQLHPAGHFRGTSATDSGLLLSSIGMGTYLGQPDPETDSLYTESARLALRSGVNVLDSAINYRHQRSERSIGAALAQAVAAGDIVRDQVIVCSKAGYLSFDAELPADPRRYFLTEYIERGVMKFEEIAGGMHCMAPGYVEDQLERSRRNLGLETLDVYYLHNPESQLGSVRPDAFYDRSRHAFDALEAAVRGNKIRYYGVATWNAFRLPPGERDYVSLEELVKIAREVAGDANHFRFVQLPFNLAMPEAYSLHNQNWGKHAMSTLEVARHAGLVVIGSATLMQAQLVRGLPPKLARQLHTSSDAETAIQFARSTPGLTTALIGMSHPQHVTANLAAAAFPVADLEVWKGLFQR